MGKSKQQPSSGQQPQAERDHRANDLNRNNDQFWKSRGYPERPTDWETAVPESKHPQDQGE
ncbi:hypothetical protein KYC5002_01160 [Archangium violaceum]|uniref:hypothetical protein n=1 Tax=Archangium violaceum TaxID=83451 RepID=UPI002B2809F5|nr:hypothetical protein KYC5002_01160 [Archangium gephyra]